MGTQNLLSASTPFIGRADDVAEADRLLSDPACQLLTLVGTGGSGRSARRTRGINQNEAPSAGSGVRKGQ